MNAGLHLEKVKVVTHLMIWLQQEEVYTWEGIKEVDTLKPTNTKSQKKIMEQADPLKPHINERK